MSRSCEEDPPFDYLLMLFVDAASEPLTVLPTHRVIRNLGEDGVSQLHERLAELFTVEPADATALRASFGGVGADAGGSGRFGLWTRTGGARIAARRAAFEPLLPAGSDALRGLDVVVLGAALESLCGIEPATVSTSDRVAFTKSADEAIAAVNDRAGGADAAFLLEPTPVATIIEVAEAGDVMPQKSTYFYPKALTGLVINPHEW